MKAGLPILEKVEKMRPCTGVLFVAGFLFGLAGCALQPAKKYSTTPIAAYKSAYVVVPAETDGDPAMCIQNELTKRGVHATVGPMRGKPFDVDFYVVYSDHWNWDLAMYVSSLDIQFLDNHRRTPIVSGSFREGPLHGFTSLKDVTRQVIDSMYAAK
jgi:hypothetical protein